MELLKWDGVVLLIGLTQSFDHRQAWTIMATTMTEIRPDGMRGMERIHSSAPSPDVFGSASGSGELEVNLPSYNVPSVPRVEKRPPSSSTRHLQRQRKPSRRNLFRFCGNRNAKYWLNANISPRRIVPALIIQAFSTGMLDATTYADFNTFASNRMRPLSLPV